MLQQSHEQRYLNLDSMKNTRDLGGYETKSGQYTKVKKYIRGSSSANLSLQDKKNIIEYGITHVLDLRSVFEIEHQPSLLQHGHFEYCNIPLLQETTMSILPDLSQYEGMSGYYIYLLEANKKQIKLIFEYLYENLGQNILFHCSSGKDRTGLISALLLDLAGCFEQDIVVDYRLSNEYNQEMINKLKAVMPQKDQPFLYALDQYMIEVLDYIYDEFGSAKGYLMDCGVSLQKIEDIINDFIL